jgi:PAS domain S-box-containing protein
MMLQSASEPQEHQQQLEAELAHERRRNAELEQRVRELETQLGNPTSITALAEERNLLRTLIDSMPDYIFVKDTEHRYLLNNVRHARELANLSPEELIGHKVSDFGPAEAAELFHDDENQVLTTGTALIDRVEAFAGRDGQMNWHSTTKVPLRNLKGEIIGLVGISRDITERKRAELKLEQALKAERELVDLRARFVSMAAHEFRTPLASILSATELIHHYRDRLTAEQLDQRLRDIADQVMFLTDIVENFLQAARTEMGKTELTLQPTSLTAVCQEIIDDFQRRPNFQHQFSMRSDDPPPALLDKQRMRQVLLNLVANAVKYSPHGTTITIELTHTPNELTCSISDQGIGIPEADQAHLFEMFYRATNAAGVSGTGLGLAIAKQVVDLHQGKITCCSAQDQGTTFTVKLPYRELEVSIPNDAAAV